MALYRIRFYKQQGIQAEFSPLVGSYFMKTQSSFSKHNDALYDLKAMAEKTPDMKALVRNFGATPVLILFDPTLKKHFAFQHDLYEVGDFFGEFFNIFTTGLVGVNGDEWKKQRKIISQSFHFEFIKDNLPVILKTTREHLKELSQKNLEGINILSEMEKVTGDVVGRIFFSENFKDYKIKGKPVGTYLIDTLENVGKSFMSVGYLLFGPKYIQKGFWKSHRNVMADVQLLKDTCSKILNDRKEAKLQNKDLAWYLLESQKNIKEEDRLSDQAIISNYVTFIMAGTNTTAHLVVMTLYALSLNPDIQEKLREEITKNYDTETDPISLYSLNKLNYLSATLKETLRVYNPTSFGPTFKSSVKDHNIGDIKVKKGTIVGAAHIFTYFNAKYFDNPHDYNPQRWIEKPNVSETYAYTPFWAGPRNCIGQHLAMLEARIILCEFIRMFDFKVSKNYKLRMNALKGYGPEGGLKMDLNIR